MTRRGEPDDGPAAGSGGEDPVVAIVRAMVRLRRRQARRVLGVAAGRRSDRPAAALEFMPVLDAVEDGADRGGGDVTVGHVARVLGIDPSRGSRLVAGAIEAGYVLRAASQADGRRSCLELTAAGQDLLDRAREVRRVRVERVLGGWTAAERESFARLLTRFADGMDEQG